MTMRLRGPATGLVVAGSALTAACGAERTTETFSGTLAAQSSAYHTIAVAEEGEVTATLTTLDPAVTIGLAIGEESSGTCSRSTSNDAATSGTALSTEVEEEGSYCVSVYDVGNVSGSANYSLTVDHP
jgi:hypothetical protein